MIRGGSWTGFSLIPGYGGRSGLRAILQVWIDGGEVEALLCPGFSLVAPR